MNDLLQTPGCGTPPAELVPASGRPCLLWIGSTEHAHVGRSYKIASDDLSIGRSDDADLAMCVNTGLAGGATIGLLAGLIWVWATRAETMRRCNPAR